MSSPQIVWDVDWMDKFLKDLRKQGGDVDYMAVHWYGSYKDLAGFKKWVAKIHKRYNKAVWVTEYGVTSSSHPSQSDIKNFHVSATKWMKAQGYVKRAAWLGCFAVTSPPDSFAAARNAFFNHGGSFRKWSSFYFHSGAAKRELTAEPAKRSPGAVRHSDKRHHRAIMEEQARRAEEEAQAAEAEAEANADEEEEDDGVVYAGEANDCDEFCQKRQSVVEAAADDLLGENDEGDDYVDVD